MKKILAYKNIESLEDVIDGLYERYMNWVTQAEEWTKDDYIEIFGADEHEKLLAMCDILENPEQLQKLKDKCKEYSHDYNDKFRVISIEII